MNFKKITTFFAFGAIAAVVLFEFDWVLDFGHSEKYEIPDPAIEALYESCYAIKDNAMHRQAFGTIDNPDVQREFISANRAIITAECRAEFPQQLIAEETDTSPNLIDVSPRFW